MTETTELLEKVDDDLLLLEKNPGYMELLNHIFRLVHTVKGAASFLEFELLVKVNHKSKDILNRLRKGELAVDNKIMDDILEAIDLVKLLVDDIKKDNIVVVGIAEKRLGLVVTRQLGQQEVAIKSLGNYLADVPGIAGSTILGEGKVTLIVDPAKLIEGGDEEMYRLAY